MRKDGYASGLRTGRPPGAVGWSMKITCILTSFNRPRWVRDALKSLEWQTFRDFEVILLDDSSLFDIRPVAEFYDLPKLRVFHTDVTPEQRAKEYRLSINMNKGLAEAMGDLICFLCDDDYYSPTWFQKAHAFFSRPCNAEKTVGYGRLIHSYTRRLSMPAVGVERWPGTLITEPLRVLDHNQVMHRKLTPPCKWPESLKNPDCPDGIYFEEMVKAGHAFYPINALAVVKRMHPKMVGTTWKKEISKMKAEGRRD